MPSDSSAVYGPVWMCCVNPSLYRTVSLWNETLLSPRIVSKRSQLHVNLPEHLPTSALSARLNQTSAETSQPVSRKFRLKRVACASDPARERGCVSRYMKHLENSFKKRIYTLDNIESW